MPKNAVHRRNHHLLHTGDHPDHPGRRSIRQGPYLASGGRADGQPSPWICRDDWWRRWESITGTKDWSQMVRFSYTHCFLPFCHSFGFLKIPDTVGINFRSFRNCFGSVSDAPSSAVAIPYFRFYRFSLGKYIYFNIGSYMQELRQFFFNCSVVDRTSAQ